jgi:hypothetical protein
VWWWVVWQPADAGCGSDDDDHGSDNDHHDDKHDNDDCAARATSHADA